MKNIVKQEQWVMLPTDDTTHIVDKKGTLEFNEKSPLYGLKQLGWSFQHLYLVSKEEIKESDWCLNTSTNTLFQAKDFEVENCNAAGYIGKVIATTDKLLNQIKLIPNKGKSFQGFPQIPESFVKHYIGNQSKVGRVEIEFFVRQCMHPNPTFPHGCTDVQGCYGTSGKLEGVDDNCKYPFWQVKLTKNNEIIINTPEAEKKRTPLKEDKTHMLLEVKHIVRDVCNVLGVDSQYATDYIKENL